jgi:hypothetical protein
MRRDLHLCFGSLMTRQGLVNIWFFASLIVARSDPAEGEGCGRWRAGLAGWRVPRWSDGRLHRPAPGLHGDWCDRWAGDLRPGGTPLAVTGESVHTHDPRRGVAAVGITSALVIHHLNLRPTWNVGMQVLVALDAVFVAFLCLVQPVRVVTPPPRDNLASGR